MYQGWLDVYKRQAGQVCGCGQYEFRIKDNGIGMSPELDVYKRQA